VHVVLDGLWQRAMQFAVEHWEKIEALTQELESKQASTSLSATLCLK
jgi:hypothetical protein